MKKILSLFFVVTLCTSLVFTVSAEPKYNRIVDTMEVLDEAQITEMEAYAAQLTEEFGIDVLVLLIADTDQANTIDYAKEYYADGLSANDFSKNGVLLIYNLGAREWYIYKRGRAENIFPKEENTALWAAFRRGVDSYGYENVKGYLEFLELKLMEKGVLPIPEENLRERLVDEGNLLTDEQEDALLKKLDEISERQKCDVIVLTVETLGEKTSTEYADDFFDYNGYGYGDERDGILLLRCQNSRDWAISTHAFGIEAFTDAGQERLMSFVIPYLSKDRNEEAFNEFADQCDKFLTQARMGDPYDTHNLERLGLQKPLTNVVIALAVGIFVAFMIVASMKRSLKSVRFQAKADSYLRKNSLNIRNGYDNFLYKNVSRTVRQTSSGGGSGGGSSTHSSSSGSSHGGSSGKC